MNISDFREFMKNNTAIMPGTDIYHMFHKLSQEALKITMEINNKYHTPDEITELFSKLTGKNIDKSFRLFPPFYTDCGKNLEIGKNVFINACCKFQDQGGIFIDDGCLIGHNVTIATVNHNYNPKKRLAMNCAAVRLGKNVWVGSDTTILPSVAIGDGAIIGAGSVVTKNIPANCIAAGNPCRVIRFLEVV